MEAATAKTTTRRKHAAAASPRLAADDSPAIEPAPKRGEAVSTNESPLDYMLRVMRDPNEDDERRDAMAKAALPYMHARLSTVDGQLSDQVSDNEGGTITFTWQPPQK